MSLALLLLGLPLLSYAADNGMDMSMDDGMTLATGTMMTTLHFSRGDTLWFAGWVPQNAGAVAGSCIGLFILALFDRWLATVRAMMELHWRETGERIRRAKQKGQCDADEAKGKKRFLRLRAPPFILAHDVMRDFGFALMLAVMTFQAAFIITIALGLGVGEMLFGRYAGTAAAAH
ncbi:CTR copper uptake transporter [Mycena vulgaris]|nr:CTR copper uptake transporter [Mycena vulgaris]